MLFLNRYITLVIIVIIELCMSGIRFNNTIIEKKHPMIVLKDTDFTVKHRLELQRLHSQQLSQRIIAMKW